MVVTGAGAGGASAAMEAARHGIPTILVDSASVPFLRQLAAKSRKLHPTQYDWPAAHYMSGALQYNGQPLPLHYPPERADKLSIAWRRDLDVARSRHSQHFHIYYDITKVRPSLLKTPAGGLSHSLGVTFHRNGSPSFSIKAGALIKAYGIGHENCSVVVNGTPCYEGQPFWGPDNFSSLLQSQHHVLISGSGDGALQDFLRIMTGGQRAIDILRSIQSTGALSSSMLLEIMSAEDEAHRGRSWAHDQDSTLRQKHQFYYFKKLEETHRSIAKKILTNIGVQKVIKSILDHSPSVKIVYKEPFITSYYGLNRFLTILIAEYSLHNNHTPRNILYPECVITNITPTGKPHVCMQPSATGQPRANGTYSAHGVLLTHACFGQDHWVTFGAVPSASLPSWPPPAVSPPPGGTYNVIIIRHGLARSLLPASIKRSNHLFPYGQT